MTWANPDIISLTCKHPERNLAPFLEMTARDATILDHKWTHSIYDSIIQASGLLKRTCFSLRRYTAFKRSIAPGRSWYLVSTIIGTNFAKHSASNCWVPSFIIWATSLGSNKIASCKMLQGCSIQVVTGWGCKYCKYEMGKWDKIWWNESMCMCRYSSVDYLNSQSRDWVNTT